MKKYVFFICFLLVLKTSNAQYLLSGSDYVQHFDSLASGIPPGWSVDTNAKAGTLGGSAAGSFVATPATATRWGNVSGAFKNVASANGFSSFASAINALQLAAKDRALGIKQTGTFGDAGAAFVFEIDNTFKLSDFELSFKLQSLDSSAGSRTTVWQLQYGLGDKPMVFTTVSSGTFTTGANTFANNLVNVSFGSALDDQRQPVWIRLVTLSVSTGSGARTTTAIDDVTLSWTGVAVPSFRPLVAGLSPLNGAVDVPIGSTLMVDFNRNIICGATGNYYIKNETDNTIQTIAATDSSVKMGTKSVVISGVSLAPNKVYHVTFDSSVVDTAGLAAYPVGDTTEWRFSTVKSLPASLNEQFDTSCARSLSLPAGWSKVNLLGAAQEWNCYEYSTGNASFRMYGADTSNVYVANEDWLISPLLDLSAMPLSGITFSMLKKGTGDELEVLVSHDYAGSGSPVVASWAALGIVSGSGDTAKWQHYFAPLAAYTSAPLYIAFKYTSSGTAGYDIQLDSIKTALPTNVADVPIPQLDFKVVGYPDNHKLELRFVAKDAGKYTVEMYNAMGRRVYAKDIMAVTGTQTIMISDYDLPSGIYLLKMTNGNTIGMQKCILK